MPDDHRREAAPHGVTGTIVVEAMGSLEGEALLDENQWLLDLADREPKWILGVVGRLDPGHPSFRKHLPRLAVHPRFRGIRVRPQRLRIDSSAVIEDLERLSEANLSLDVNSDHTHLETLARLASALPDLRIMVNHVANVPIDGRAPPREWVQAIHTVARHRNVYCKFSRLVEAAGGIGGEAPREASHYRPVSDVVWDAFGENRLVYGSNWPVCTRFARYEEVQALAVALLKGRSDTAVHNVLSHNPRQFYRVGTRKA